MYYFALESEVAIPSNPEQPLDKSLGAEFDAWGSYSFTNEVNVFLGGSLIFGTSSMDSIKGVTEGQTGAWIYTGVCFKPTFFSSAN